MRVPAMSDIYNGTISYHIGGMRLRQFVFLPVVVCLIASSAFAQQSMRIAPTTFSPAEESFLALYVDGLLETDAITITYSRPNAPPMSVEPSSVYPDHLIAWVPSDITNVEGQYSVDVYIVRSTQNLHYGPASFTVAVPPPPQNPPVAIYVPEAVVVEAVSAAGAPVGFYVFSNDGTPVTCAPLQNTYFPLGATTVTCTANNGQSTDTRTFPVFVQDTTAPVITVPADIVTDTPTVTFSVTATDTIDGALSVACDPASGSTFPFGTTTVNCVAVDDQLNYAYGSFTVTVTGGGVPVLTVPANINVEATSPEGAVVTFEATATNGGVVTCNPPSGSTFPIGTTSVNCTATNGAGSDTEVFQVRVRDTQAPVILRVAATPAALWPPDHKMVPVTVSVIAVDAADAAPSSSIVSVSSNQPVDGTGDGDTSPDWEITGPLTLELRAERAANGQTRIYTIVVETTDDSGNSSTAATEVMVYQSKRRAH
jgi:hypothetical protein